MREQGKRQGGGRAQRGVPFEYVGEEDRGRTHDNGRFEGIRVMHVPCLRRVPRVRSLNTSRGQGSSVTHMGKTHSRWESVPGNEDSRAKQQSQGGSTAHLPSVDNDITAKAPAMRSVKERRSEALTTVTSS